VPGEDGYSLIRKLRSRSAELGGNLPAAAVTAYARSEDRIRALAAGFQAHLAKPIDPAELVATIAALVGRQALQ
jgi:CheY-like chemotaxis protein